MKDKTIWQLAFGIVIVALVLSATGRLPGLTATANQGTSVGVVATSDNSVGVVVSCYQEETGPTYGLEGAYITILDSTGVAVYPKTAASSGTVSLNTQSGFKKGGKYTVVCENNTNTGAYRAYKDVTFDKDVNAVEVPMRNVGIPSVTLYAGGVAGASLTVAANDYKYFEMDLSTSATKTWLYKPIVAIKDQAGSTLLNSGDISAIDVSQAVKVSCDSDNPAMAGYNQCYQLNQEWVSAQTPVAKLQIHVTSKTNNPAGNLTVSVFDGVPGAAAGVTSINLLDAYSTNSASAVQVIA